LMVGADPKVATRLTAVDVSRSHRDIKNPPAAISCAPLQPEELWKMFKWGFLGGVTWGLACYRSARHWKTLSQEQRKPLLCCIAGLGALVLGLIIVIASSASASAKTSGAYHQVYYDPDAPTSSTPPVPSPTPYVSPDAVKMYYKLQGSATEVGASWCRGVLARLHPPSRSKGTIRWMQ